MNKKRVQHPIGGEKLVQQHHADAANINNIMERYNRTGLLQGPGPGTPLKPRYMEVTGQSYHEMLTKIQDIQGQFAGLPGKVRRRFAHNPEQLLKFLEDPKNLPEAIRLGLVQEEDLPDEKRQQLDLVREAEREEMEEFKRWKSERASGASQGPPWDEDEESEANNMPNNPRPSGKKKSR